MPKIVGYFEKDFLDTFPVKLKFAVESVYDLRKCRKSNIEKSENFSDEVFGFFCENHSKNESCSNEAVHFEETIEI